MQLDELVPFLGGAFAVAALGSLTLATALRLWRPELAAGRWIAAVFALLVFAAMTQLPLPDRATLTCPVATATPQLRPFAWTQAISELRRWHSGDPAAWIGNRTLQATAMNFLLCLLIGLLFVRAGLSVAATALLGTVLTLTVETTQLTGFWGLYPCAWRQFNVDDLMLNLAGVLTGALIWRWRRPVRPNP